MFTAYENAQFNPEKNTVEINVQHAAHGWIPHTIRLDSVGKHQQAIVDQLDIASLPVIQSYVPTVSELAEQKVSDVKLLREAELVGDPVTITLSSGQQISIPIAVVELDDGRQFQVNKIALDELAETVTLSLALGQVPEGTVWRDVSNVNHPADMALLSAIAIKVAERKNAIWQNSWSHADDLRDLTTVQEINDYVLPTTLVSSS